MDSDSTRAGEAGGSQSDMTDGEAAEAFAKKVKDAAWEGCELENKLNIAQARLQVFRVKQRVDEEERLAAALNVQEAMREERRSSRASPEEDASASQSAQGKVLGRAQNSATKKRLKAIQWPKTWEKIEWVRGGNAPPDACLGCWWLFQEWQGFRDHAEIGSGKWCCKYQLLACDDGRSVGAAAWDAAVAQAGDVAFASAPATETTRMDTATAASAAAGAFASGGEDASASAAADQSDSAAALLPTQL